MKFLLNRLIIGVLLSLIFSSTSLASNESNVIKADKAYKRGEAFYKLKKYENALKFFEYSYQLDPDPGVANNIGVIYNNLKEYDEAISWYKNAISLNEKNGSYFSNLGSSYDELKDYENAVKFYKKALFLGDHGGGTQFRCSL